MLVFNQQANIKNVNGAIADIFANRPAPQTTYYLFYSTDTQEIFYDNGAWILLGSGGGGGVNIYNSDGILTGNRQLDGSNNSLSFVNVISFEAYNSFFTIKANNSFTDIINNDIRLNIDGANNVLKTTNLGNDIGLKLDFANNNYQLSDGTYYYLYIDGTNQNIQLNCNNTAFSLFADNINKYITIGQTSDQVGFTFYNDFPNNIFVSKMGDPLGLVNECTFQVDSLNQIIKTTNQNNDIGLFLDFANSKYYFGDSTGGNNVYFEVDNNLKKLKSLYAGNGDGLLFDFVNSVYRIGQLTTGNTTYLEVNDNSIISTNYQGNEVGLKFSITTQEYFFGDFGNTTNGTSLFIEDNNSIIKSKYQNNEQGLELQFINKIYRYGHLVGGNQTQINIIDTLQTIILESSYNIPGEEVRFIITGGANSVISTQYQQNDIGLKLDFANKEFQFGDFGNTTNGTSLFIEDNNSIIKTKYQANDIGLKLDFANQFYDFGDINNLCYYRADVNNNYIEIVAGSNAQIQMSATNGDTFITNNLVEIINPTLDLSFKLIDSVKIIQTNYQSNNIGLKLDFINSVYQFGQLAVGNTTYLSIDDAAAYPVQIDGTNILSGTSGGNSGQHLKIKLNGVDYKIKLENP